MPVDPLASLNLGASSRLPAYKNLSVALLLSENTRNTGEQLEKWNQMMVYNQAAQVNLNYIFRGLSEIFKSNFGSVITVRSIEEAQKSNVDLIAVLDIKMELSNFIWNPTRAEITSIMLNSDKTEISRIRGEGTRKGHAVVATAFNDAQNNFELALLNSQELHKYSKEKTRTAQTALSNASAAPGIDKPSFPPESRVYGENDVAVVIGIEKYQNVPPSDYSYNDAVLVKTYLVALGMKERNIDLLTNEKATQSAVRRSLETWLPNRLKKDSRVFVYFSGHGAPEPVSGEAYIVPSDGDPNYLPDTGYSLKRLYEKAGKLAAAEVIVMLDSCFNGAGGRSLLAKGARPLVMVSRISSVSPNMAVITSTQGFQISTSSSEKGHGIFTYYFLKSVKEGKKSLAEIYEYIKPQVEDEAKALNVQQSPGLNPPPDKIAGKFILRR
jgi:hypothetical protein